MANYPSELSSNDIVVPQRLCCFYVFKPSVKKRNVASVRYALLETVVCQFARAPNLVAAVYRSLYVDIQMGSNTVMNVSCTKMSAFLDMPLGLCRDLVKVRWLLF